MNNEITHLLALMTSTFSREEIQELCFTINIDYEDFPPNLTKKVLLLELIQTCQRLNRMPTLLDVCRGSRPKVQWPDNASFVSEPVATLDQATARLAALMKRYFSRQEVPVLCVDIGIDSEEFSPTLSKTALFIVLIQTCERRYKIEQLLDACRDKRPEVDWPTVAHFMKSFEPEMCPVPAGPFKMGWNDSRSIYEQGEHEVVLPAYHISRFPITNEQYAVFVRQGNYAPPRGWLRGNHPAGQEKSPVISVSWLDAVAYCQWLQTQTGKPYRLPTEAEWEKAARGTDDRLYPWGPEWKSGRCNAQSNSLTDVDAFPDGASPYSCEDMVGNVRQWTTTLWGISARTPEYQYPYQYDKRDRWQTGRLNDFRILRGSYFKDRRHELTVRSCYEASAKSPKWGIRVVISQAEDPFVSTM